MSDLTIPPMTPAPSPAPGPGPAPSVRTQRRAEQRSFLARAWLDATGGAAARIGLAWIAVVAFCAVFAPFLANSHPYLLKMGGRWSSPFLRHLEPADVCLLVAFFAALGVAFAPRLTFGRRAALFVWVVAVSIPLTYWPTAIDNWADWRKSIGPGLLYVLAGLFGLALLAGIALLPWACGLSRRGWAVVAVLMAALAGVLIAFPIRPPLLIVYSQYRELTQQGQVQYALYAPIPYSPSDRLRDQSNMRFQPPSRTHLMGTETDGADILSRMIHASRIAMSIGFISTGIAVIIGVTLGALMGYFSGWVDLFGMRLVDIFAAIPTLYLLLTFVAFYGRNLYLIMVIIGLTSWVGYAIYVRAEFLRLREQDFVQAARACGLPLRSILFRHMLPNGITPVLVNASFGVASAILAEAYLSFLGIGLIDQPSWGQLLNQALGESGGFVWWLALFPGLAIFLTVFGYNLLGEAIRDAIDPYVKCAA